MKDVEQLKKERRWGKGGERKGKKERREGGTDEE
jgi:hypothetical protein